MSLPKFSPAQEAILAAVRRHPAQFSRSGLAQMLAAARSWQDTPYPEYGRLRRHKVGDWGKSLYDGGAGILITGAAALK